MHNVYCIRILSIAFVITASARAEPLTPEAAVVQALRAPQATVSRLAARIPESDVVLARSAILPRLDLNASAARNFIGDRTVNLASPVLTKDASGNDTLSFSQQQREVTGQSTPEWALGATATQLVYDGGKWNANLEAVRAALQSAGALRDEALLDVALTTWTRFFETVRAEQSLATLDAAITRDTAQVDAADKLFEAGRVSKSDALIARANLSQDRLVRIAEARALAQSRTDLVAALGGTVDATWLAPGDLLVDVAAAPTLPENLAQAKLTRPLLRQLAHNVAAAEANARAAQGAWSPTVSLFANYSRQGPVLGDVLGNPARQYSASAGVQGTFNAFSGFATQASVEKARLQMEQAHMQVAVAETTIANEVSRAHESLASARAALTAAAEGERTATDAADFAQQRYAVGQGSLLEVRDAALKVTQARLARLSAGVDAREALGALRRAVGISPTGTALEETK